MMSNVTLFIFISIALAAENPIVKTSLGDIQGYLKQSYSGRVHSAFEGIPYAKPPVGNLRFESPLPVEAWSRTLNASSAHVCLQVESVTSNVIGSEDCLYLNIYTPNKSPKPSDNYEVIVHIHGGAFMRGSGISAGPALIMDKDVVYVSLNYRLGVLGFLSTEDSIVPGNNGLKDQAMALRWIQRHIKQFGGNPNSVTITGVSAGAASVHLHYFSKNSKNLFHRGISHSGNALMSIAIQYGALERAKQLSALVGCNHPSSQLFINCMKEKSAKLILENLVNLSSPSPLFPLSVFAPVVEPKSETAFLEDYPYNLLKSKNFQDLPLINTICEREGILGLWMIKDEIDKIDSYWNSRAHYYMDYNYTVCEADRLSVAEKLRKHYFRDKQVSANTTDELINIFGDRYFAHSFEKSSRQQAIHSKSRVYTYIFNYTSSFAEEFSKWMGLDEYYGVGHAEDGTLIYDYGYVSRGNLSQSDIFIKDELLNIYVSFAKTGIPATSGVDWDPVADSEDFTYLYVNNPHNISMVTKKEVSPTEFWDNLPIKENEKVNENACKMICDNERNK